MAYQPADDNDDDSAGEAPLCWLCERQLGSVVEWHHPVPKSRGGCERMPVHPICHRTIHARFSNTELARNGGSRLALLADAEMAKFLSWIAGKHPDFTAPTKGRNR